MTAANGAGPVGRPIPAAVLRRLGVLAVVFAAVGPPVALIGWFAMFGGVSAAFVPWLGGLALSIAAVVIAIVGLVLRGDRRLFVAALVVPFGYAVLVVAAFVALRVAVAA